MNKTMDIGRSGMQAHSIRVDRIAQNMANLETRGYKRAETTFGQLVRNAMQSDSVALSEDLPEDQRFGGSGVMALRSLTDFRQGPVEPTGHPLHLAIEGPGFFGVRDPQGTLLMTRQGDFRQDATGRIVDPSGYLLDIDPLPGQTLEIAPGTLLSMDEEGTVLAGEGQEKTPVGTLMLYGVTDPNMMLVREGYYTVDNEDLLIRSAEEPEAFGQLRTGQLERSNVDLLQEMTDMIVSQRAYQLSSKVVAAADETMGIVGNLL